MIGHGHALAGRPADAVSWLEKSFALGRLRHAFLVCQDTDYLADAYRRCSRLDEAVSMARKALDVAQRWKHTGREAHALKTLGTPAEERSMKPVVAHCHTKLAEAVQAAGDDDLGRKHFGIAQSMYEAMGMRLWRAT